VCVRSARTDLCGGCRATGIPTATSFQIERSPQSLFHKSEKLGRQRTDPLGELGASNVVT